MNTRQHALRVCVSAAILFGPPLARPLLAAAPVAVVPPAPLRDIALSSRHELCGRFVDGTGRPLEGAFVSLSWNDRVVARTVTDSSGEFRAICPASGVYLVTCANTTALLRCWTPEAAPPAAKPTAVLTDRSQVVRGQLGLVVPAAFPTVVTGTALGAGAAAGGIGFANSSLFDRGSARTARSSRSESPAASSTSEATGGSTATGASSGNSSAAGSSLAGAQASAGANVPSREALISGKPAKSGKDDPKGLNKNGSVKPGQIPGGGFIDHNRDGVDDRYLGPPVNPASP